MGSRARCFASPRNDGGESAGSRCARPGMTAVTCGSVLPRAKLSFVIPRCASSPYFVIPGRRNAPSPESITTKLRLGHDAAPVMFNSGSRGYGFRARASHVTE
jgi:hypothetical protein